MLSFAAEPSDMCGPTVGMPYLSAIALVFLYNSAVRSGVMKAWPFKFGSLIASTYRGL